MKILNSIKINLTIKKLYLGFAAKFILSDYGIYHPCILKMILLSLYKERYFYSSKISKLVCSLSSDYC